MSISATDTLHRSMAFIGANAGLALHPVDARGVQCSTGTPTRFGVQWPAAADVYPGTPGPASSAFLAVAESWAL